MKAAFKAGVLAMVLIAAANTFAARLVYPDEALQSVIYSIEPGTTIELAAGSHAGPLIIDRSLTLLGRPGSVVEGSGSGHVIIVDSAGVRISGLTVRNSGIDLFEENSGIFVTAAAENAVIENNVLEHNLIGIYLKGPHAAVVRDNRIIGRADLRMSDRGNGIHLWNTPGSRVEGNNIRYGRDGIFVTTSRNNVFLNNHISDLRFAVHYMYTNHSEVSGNISRNNHVGLALMYSTGLTVSNNETAGDRDHGIFLNFANQSEIRGNRVNGGPEKCLFVYNSNINDIHHNHLSGCDIGIHYTAGSERNSIWANNFVANRTQVKYVGTREHEWSHQGQGNYWSDFSGFDLNGDGIADRPYRPNTLVDQLLWRYPGLGILTRSPVLQVLQWAQSQFPALHPGGVYDSAPAMRPYPLQK